MIMSNINGKQGLLPSVLDRLLDDEPDSVHEKRRSDAQVLREMKESLRRDIENLLNTRWRCKSWPPNLDELETSLVNYGIPDFTGANMSLAAERDTLRRIVEKVIRQFEPRFKSVKVSMLNNVDETDRTLRFRIDALMYADPAPELVVFDSQMNPASADFEIKRQN
jgi:type VI secretion system protein ImpF